MPISDLDECTADNKYSFYNKTNLKGIKIMSNIYKSADELIGKTPLLELTNIEKEFNLKAKILGKLEYFNPAGSVKDRIAKEMIQ